MPSRSSWIQHGHEGLYNQASQTIAYLTTVNMQRMGLTGITEWKTSELIPKMTYFESAFTEWQNPATRTAVIIASLKTAEENFIIVYRKLYTGFLKNNPLVTDSDLVSMGLPKHQSGSHTPSPIPSTVPEAEVELPSQGVVRIHFRDKGSEHKAKPAGVHGAEIAWTVSDIAPTGWTALTHSSFDTKTPFSLSFDGADRGRHLYFALRWENTRGDKGPWSPIESAIIP